MDRGAGGGGRRQMGVGEGLRPPPAARGREGAAGTGAGWIEGGWGALLPVV